VLARRERLFVLCPPEKYGGGDNAEEGGEGTKVAANLCVDLPRREAFDAGTKQASKGFRRGTSATHNSPHLRALALPLPRGPLPHIFRAGNNTKCDPLASSFFPIWVKNSGPLATGNRAFIPIHASIQPIDDSGQQSGLFRFRVRILHPQDIAPRSLRRKQPIKTAPSALAQCKITRRAMAANRSARLPPVFSPRLS